MGWKLRLIQLQWRLYVFNAEIVTFNRHLSMALHSPAQRRFCLIPRWPPPARGFQATTQSEKHVIEIVISERAALQ